MSKEPLYPSTKGRKGSPSGEPTLRCTRHLEGRPPDQIERWECVLAYTPPGDIGSNISLQIPSFNNMLFLRPDGQALQSRTHVLPELKHVHTPAIIEFDLD